MKYAQLASKLERTYLAYFLSSKPQKLQLYALSEFRPSDCQNKVIKISKIKRFFTFLTNCKSFIHCMKFRRIRETRKSSEKNVIKLSLDHFLTNCQAFGGSLTTSDNFLKLLLSPLPPSPFC